MWDACFFLNWHTWKCHLLPVPPDLNMREWVEVTSSKPIHSLQPWWWWWRVGQTIRATGGRLPHHEPQASCSPLCPHFHLKKANATDPQEWRWGPGEVILCHHYSWYCQYLVLSRARGQEGEGRGHFLDWARRKPFVKLGPRTWDLTLRGWFAE